jgi:AraC-like DNA-binding protein
MSSATTSAMSAPAPQRAECDSGVQHGVDTYARVLRSAGGDQIEAFVRGGEGRGLGAALYRAPPSLEVSVPALPVSRLSVNLTHSRVGGGIDGERLRHFDAARYALFLTPAGAPMVFRKDVPSRHINIYFHAGTFDGDSDTAASPLAVPQPLFNVVVPGIRHLADQLVEEMQSAGMLNANAADSLARLLLVHVARHLQHAAASSRALTPAVLARLREHVEAHLSERILVADLARAAGLSQDRFAVAFKEQTGQSPHQFVLALRLEHAADLLSHSRLAVADVAHACGFASQQHLTNVMHRQLGITPRRFRESKQSL